MSLVQGFGIKKQ